MSFLPIILLGFVICVPLYFIWKGIRERESEHKKRIARKREGRINLSKSEFVLYYRESGFDEVLVARLYFDISERFDKKLHPLHPDDLLLEDLKIDEEELDDIAIKYFKEINDREPTADDTKRFNENGNRKLKFEDLLIFVTTKF